MLGQQFEKGRAGFGLDLLRAGRQFRENERDYFSLNLLVTFEYVNGVEKYVALLQRVLLAPQHLNSLGFREVFTDRQAFQFFRGLGQIKHG